MKKSYLGIVALTLIFGLALIGCGDSDDNGNGNENGNGGNGNGGNNDLTTLTVHNLPADGSWTAYIFTPGTDLSTFEKITESLDNKYFKAVGLISSDVFNDFIIVGWDGTYAAGAWTGSGNMPVVLFNINSTIDTWNHGYRLATVNFSNGYGTVNFSSFTAVVRGGGDDNNIKGKLIINNFPSECSLAITVYNSSEEIASIADITEILSQGLLKTIAASAGLSISSPVSLMKISNPLNVFDVTGSFLVLLAETGTLNTYYADMVLFTNGCAEIDFDKLGLISDLPLISGGTGEPISTIDYISDYLAKQKGGRDPDKAINLVLESIPLSTDNWFAILDAINTADKFVNLDLFDCIGSDNGYGECLDAYNGAFDPQNTREEGKNKIISIILPSAATKIMYAYFPAFQYFINLRSISAPNVSDIGGNVFAGLGNLISVSFPNVTSIGSEAFARCTSLSSITIPASITLVDNPFYGCVSLSSFILTDSGNLSTIESGKILVRNDTELAAYPSAKGNITIPNYITKIGNGAFAGCSGLINVIIPNSVENIGDKAFSGNMSYGADMNITAIEIPSSVKSIGNGAFDGNKITSLVIPNSVVSLGNSAFRENPLASLTISDQITEIRNHTFYGCILTSLVIPNNVKSIGFAAFYPSSELINITIGENVSFDNPAFPEGFVDAYNTTYGKTAGTYTRPNTNSTTWTKK